MCSAVSHNGAAERLVGLKLLDQWEVMERIRHDDGLSGGSRSACYRAVSPKGVVAFVKAFDFRQQELAGDTDALEKMVREYNYERNVHLFCNTQGITRITRIYGDGKVLVSSEANAAEKVAVHFLVCEWINKCMRESQPPGDDSVSAGTRLAAMRDSAAALSQLHHSGVAHQDLKPSNAMCSDIGVVKLTDLGSSSCKSIHSPPHDLDYLVGQPNYAPYELLYEYPPTSWYSRRFGCDLFLLGNLCFTSFAGVSLSHLALHKIPTQFRHTIYAGNYGEVIPHLIEAHELLIPHMMEGKVPSQLVDELSTLLLCLCHPDPMRRGHTKNIQLNNQFGLERFITRFDVLAKKANLLNREIH